MRTRYVLLAATAVLAITVAVPAFGGPSNPVADTFASAKKTAKKALKKANKANKAAKSAQGAAAAAQSTADGAQAAAAAAQTTADQAVTDAASAKAAADAAQSSADSAQSSANTKFGETNYVGGDTSALDSSNTKTVSVGCGTSGRLTGGGFIVGGPGNNEVTVTLSSAFLNGWVVQAAEITPTASNWSLTATAMCADQT